MRLTSNKYFTFTDCSKVLFCKTKSEEVDKMWKREKDKNMKLNTITRFRRKFNEALFDFKHFWLLLRNGQVNENRSESSRLNDKSPHEFNVTATFFPAFFNYKTSMFFFHRCHHHLVNHWRLLGCWTRFKCTLWCTMGWNNCCKISNESCFLSFQDNNDCLFVLSSKTGSKFLFQSKNFCWKIDL